MIPQMDLGKVNQKTFWKVFTILDDIKNIPDSGKEIRISAFTGALKTLFQLSSGWLQISRSSRRTGIRSGTWRCEWIAAISWKTSKDKKLVVVGEGPEQVAWGRMKFTSYEEVVKMLKWWQGFRVLHRFSW